MADPKDTKPEDTIELNDNEPVVFSDNPDGTPREDLPDSPKPDAAEPPADEATDGEQAAEPAGAEAPPDDDGEPEAQRQRRRKRKDLQERLDKLVRRAHESDEARAAAQAKADLLEQQLNELRKGRPADPPDDRERAAMDRKAKALQDLDLAAYDAAVSELMDIRLERVKVAERPKQEAPPARAQDEGGIHPAAQAWLDRNAWFKEKPHLAAEVIRIEDRLIKSGMQRGEDLYKKIDEELDAAPEFDSVRASRIQPPEDPPEDPPAPAPRPRNIISPPSRGDTAPQQRPRPGALTKYDIETMTRFGLDHKDPKARAAYLARKSA
jgi:hypothetical protein